MPAENERDEEYCPDFARRLPVAAKDCTVCRTKGYCPPDCTGHAPRRDVLGKEKWNE